MPTDSTICEHPEDKLRIEEFYETRFAYCASCGEQGWPVLADGREPYPPGRPLVGPHGPSYPTCLGTIVIPGPYGMPYEMPCAKFWQHLGDHSSVKPSDGS